MLYRIEAGLHPHLDDTVGRNTAQHMLKALDVAVDAVRQVKVFTVDGLDEAQVRRLVDEAIWHDPVLQRASLSTPLPMDPFEADWILEVGYRPGVTDNEGRTARDTAAMVLRRDRRDIAVYTSIQYRIKGTALDKATVERVARDLLCNELIQRYQIKSREEWRAAPGFAPRAARVTGAACADVTVVPLSSMDDATMCRVSRENTWALNLDEMRAIRSHYARPEVRERRAALGLPADPTDAELEASFAKLPQVPGLD